MATKMGQAWSAARHENGLGTEQWKKESSFEFVFKVTGYGI